MVEGKGGSDRAGVYRPPGYGFSIRTMPWRQSVGRDQRDMGKGHRPTSGIAAGVAESLKLFDIGRMGRHCPDGAWLQRRSCWVDE